MTIEDLGSTNGTIVRGNAIAPGQPTEISVGDVVNLGTLNLMLQQHLRPVRPRRLWTPQYFEARLEEEYRKLIPSTPWNPDLGEFWGLGYSTPEFVEIRGQATQLPK